MTRKRERASQANQWFMEPAISRNSRNCNEAAAAAHGLVNVKSIRPGLFARPTNPHPSGFKSAQQINRIAKLGVKRNEIPRLSTLEKAYAHDMALLQPEQLPIVGASKPSVEFSRPHQCRPPRTVSHLHAGNQGKPRPDRH